MVLPSNLISVRWLSLKHSKISQCSYTKDVSWMEENLLSFCLSASMKHLRSIINRSFGISMGLPSILFRDACKLSCSIRFPIYLFASLLAAFQELGLDCANWTEPVYADLLRCYSSPSHLWRLNCEGWWWTKLMRLMDKGCEWFTGCLLCCLVCHRQAGGIEEAMLTAFFDRVCSPASIFPLCQLDEFWDWV